jgi:Tfp pilus assembly protein PilX
MLYEITGWEREGGRPWIVAWLCATAILGALAVTAIRSAHEREQRRAALSVQPDSTLEEAKALLRDARSLCYRIAMERGLDPRAECGE